MQTMQQGWRHAACILVLLSTPAFGQSAGTRDTKAAPLTIGETFTIESKALGETRRSNVYLPPPCAEPAEARCPVLYMPDGGIGEDFLHVAGLVQVSVGNDTMRPFRLVGIENTQRRRDLTGPTQNTEDRKIAPQVGGAAAFRRFVRAELMPAVKARYRTTDETAINGECAAGLVVVESVARRCGGRIFRERNPPPRAGFVRHLHRLRSEPVVERRRAGEGCAAPAVRARRPPEDALRRRQPRRPGRDGAA